MEAALQAEQTNGIDDTSLVQRVQAGDGQAYAELVRRYQDRVFNACWRICGRLEVARDLTQDAFLKAYASIQSFQGKSGFYTWLYRIAVNLALSHRRQARLRLVKSLDEAAGSQDSAGDGPLADRIADPKSTDPADQASAGELKRHVAAALQAVDEHHRVVLVLRDIEGFDYARIAEILEVPVGTIKSRVFRARSALRELLDRMSRKQGRKSDSKDEDIRSRQTG